MMKRDVSLTVLACLEAKGMLQVHPSVMGTGSLKKLCSVCPLCNNVAAMPVKAVAETCIKRKKAQNVLINCVLCNFLSDYLNTLVSLPF